MLTDHLRNRVDRRVTTAFTLRLHLRELDRDRISAALLHFFLLVIAHHASAIVKPPGSSAMHRPFRSVDSFMG
jgi:hypothetical protein